MPRRSDAPSLPARPREGGVDLREQRGRPYSKLRVGDVQHLGLGRADTDERAAFGDRAHGAMAVFATVERVDEDVLDGLRAPSAAAWRRNASAVEGHGGRVKGAAAFDKRLAYAHDNGGEGLVYLPARGAAGVADVAVAKGRCGR